MSEKRVWLIGIGVTLFLLAMGQCVTPVLKAPEVAVPKVTTIKTDTGVTCYIAQTPSNSSIAMQCEK